MPHGRDAQIAAGILREGGFLAVICAEFDGFVAEIAKGAGFGLLTEEAIATADLHGLAGWLEGQPEWSDFPFILITQRGGRTCRLGRRMWRRLSAVCAISFRARWAR
jgi:hypothetical protein